MPVEHDVPATYRVYYTHLDEIDKARRPVSRLYQAAEAGYHALRYGYRKGSVSLAARCVGALAALHPGRRRHFDARVMYLPAMPGGRLLDVGCGDGSLIRLLQSYGWHAEGCDMDPRAVEAARVRGLDVHLGRLEERGYRDGTFDVVTMRHLVEHVPDPIALLREVRRILKETGRLVALTPNAESWGHRMYGSAWRGLEPPRHLHMFTARALGRMASEAGLGVVRCEAVCRAYDVLRASHGAGCCREGLATNGSFVRKCWTRFFELLEGCGDLLSLDAGEEIVLIAGKTAAAPVREAPAAIPGE
jgi:2-polyprenyl-3-methyl-5-hydroxy-6-metoxy-1,4-benzoquinol methylase